MQKHTTILKKQTSGNGGGSVDILTGGFPCQPFSTAGKRKGTEDTRYLWPEMLRAIREIRPRWVVGENVRGLVNWNDGLVFDKVCADLETEGYEVFPVLLPACGINAPHRRERIFFIAHASGNGHKPIESGESRSTTRPRVNEKEERERLRTDTRGISEQGIIADARSEQFQKRASVGDGSDKTEEGTGVDYWIERSGNVRDAADTNSQQRCKGGMHPEGPEATKRYTSPCDARGHECYAWKDFPTQPPVCSGDDGLSGRLVGITFPKWRSESLKAHGNAVVPRLVYKIFEAIENYELIHT